MLKFYARPVSKLKTARSAISRSTKDWIYDPKTRQDYVMHRYQLAISDKVSARMRKHVFGPVHDYQVVNNFVPRKLEAMRSNVSSLNGMEALRLSNYMINENKEIESF